MSPTWVFALLTLCLNWTQQSLGICLNVAKLECRDFHCPGIRTAGQPLCGYDSTLRKYLCDPSCPNDPNRDPCTCLANYKGCHIRVNTSDAASQAMFEGATQTTYSCINSSAVRNCDYDVHVLSAFRGNGDTVTNCNWDAVFETGNITVDINVSGVRSDKAVVLVLLSHHPTYWTLNVPSGLSITKVLLSSYHVHVTEVSYSTGSVLSVEKVSNKLLPSLAYGFDEYDHHVMQALEYLTRRFGSVSSFTGAYEADWFTLSIHGGLQDQSGCVPFVSPGAVSSPVISAQCYPTINRCTGIYDPTDNSCSGIDYRAICTGDGYCRCPNVLNIDERTCLAKFGSCNIEKSARGENSAGKPFYQQRPQITSSCVANDNRQYSVHVISTHGTKSTEFDDESAPITVMVSVSGDEEDTRPVILFLMSYYPVRWSLINPSGVVFERVILCSHCYPGQSFVSYDQGSVLSADIYDCGQTVPCYSDGYGDDTVEQLRYVSDRFGPVSSWSSAYRTDAWNLNIQRKSGASPSPVHTAPTTPPFSPSSPLFTDPDSNKSPSITVPRSYDGIVIGIVVTVAVLATAAAIIVLLVVVVVCKRKAAGNTGHRYHQLPPQQQTLTQQDQLQRSSIHHSVQPHVDVQTNATMAATLSQSHCMVLSPPPHTAGDLTNSAPPDYDEAVNYPAPMSMVSMSPPPPYPQ